jgi:hypothetical protein
VSLLEVYEQVAGPTIASMSALGGIAVIGQSLLINPESLATLARLPLTVLAMLAILAQAHGRKTTTEKSTLVVERAPEGRVTSGSWDGEKVVLKDRVLEVRNVALNGFRADRPS